MIKSKIIPIKIIFKTYLKNKLKFFILFLKSILKSKYQIEPTFSHVFYSVHGRKNTDPQIRTQKRRSIAGCEDMNERNKKGVWFLTAYLLDEVRSLVSQDASNDPPHGLI